MNPMIPKEQNSTKNTSIVALNFVFIDFDTFEVFIMIPLLRDFAPVRTFSLRMMKWTGSFP